MRIGPPAEFANLVLYGAGKETLHLQLKREKKWPPTALKSNFIKRRVIRGRDVG